MKKVIVTGQQIGLLGGPMYTTFKVLGAVAISRKMNGRAVYWLETNDADFEEINRIEYLDNRGELNRLKWNKNSRGYSCGFIPVDRNLVSVIERFFKSVRQTEFTDRMKNLALGTYRIGRSLGQASKELAVSLFSGFGVEVFDPQDRDFLAASRDILLDEALQTPSGSQCNLFCMIGKKRVAVFRKGKAFTDRDGHVLDLDKVDLVPNVKTRNIIQDRYFGTAVYVAGPSEMAYIRNLDEQYARHRVTKPEIIPRMSITLIEPKARRILDQFGLDVSDVHRTGKDAFLKKVMENHTGFDYRAVLSESRRFTENYLSELDKLGLDAGRLRGGLTRSIKEMAGLTRAEAKGRASGILEKARYLHDNLLPFGKKQERVFNLFYYMNLYGGMSFLNWLLERYDRHTTIMEIKNAT